MWVNLADVMAEFYKIRHANSYDCLRAKQFDLQLSNKTKTRKQSVKALIRAFTEADVGLGVLRLSHNPLPRARLLVFIRQGYRLCAELTEVIAVAFMHIIIIGVCVQGLKLPQHQQMHCKYT